MAFLVLNPAEKVLSRDESDWHLTSECEAGETDADATDIYLKIFKIFYTILMIARRSEVKGHEHK